jgi:hypothetical protein
MGLINHSISRSSRDMIKIVTSQALGRLRQEDNEFEASLGYIQSKSQDSKKKRKMSSSGGFTGSCKQLKCP